MLLYITVGSNDIPRATRFYDAVLETIGVVRRKSLSHESGYAGRDDGRVWFWVVTPYDKKKAHFGNGSMTAFEAPSRSAVDAFHKAALAAGGTDEGGPGLRTSHHPHFYSCYVRDPDGNKLSAVYEKPV
jgi:catechol 2,3-dioxygenase-like lactoylglutathione lyase family enzyme